VPTNQNIISVFQQQKQQQQQQQQQQNNRHHRHHGNIVPAPPAWLLGVLGLPVFAVLRRRKKAGSPLTEV
jgi:MYXO-CTERM domain-containing protein